MAKKKAASKKPSRKAPAKASGGTAARAASKSTTKTAGKSATRTAGKSDGTRAKRTKAKAPAGVKKAPTVKAKRSATSRKPAAKRARSTSKASVPSKTTAVKSAPKRRRTRKTASEIPATTSAAPVQPIKLVSPFTAKELEEFRVMLLEKRAQLIGDLGTLQKEALGGSRREVSGDLSSMPVHMADLGTDNYELEFTLGLLEGERAVLGEIDEALQRIRGGTYGVCLGTGKPIGKARLRAKPWAKYCYEYTLAMEKGKPPGF